MGVVFVYFFVVYGLEKWQAKKEQALIKAAQGNVPEISI